MSEAEFSVESAPDADVANGLAIIARGDSAAAVQEAVLRLSSA